ncbi:MAG: TetR/AcrR family transcriptional regulator [Bacillota bacterium]
MYQQQREQVKKNILDTSIAIFREKGYENTTIDEITKSIGIAKGTFYNFYPSKSEILISWAAQKFQKIAMHIKLNCLFFSNYSYSSTHNIDDDPKYSEVYRVILGQFIQGWSGSAVSVFNQLAYAILGIPSIIFGVLLIKNKKLSTLGGWLLTLNGISCIIGLIGTAANNRVLVIGSVAGGALFLFALIALVRSCANGADRNIPKGDKEISID